MKRRLFEKRVMALILSFTLIMPAMSQSLTLAAVDKGMAETNDSKDSEEETLPYLDYENYTFEERAADLVSRMTLEEKVAQLITGGNINSSDGAAAIPRLGVTGYNWWQEGLHGVARTGEATSFQTGLGIAATWNPDLVEQLGGVTGNEARAYYLEGRKDGRVQGLNYWSPTINLSRDPRWGRADETYGEDPYLTAKIGTAYVEGMQGTNEGTGYLKTIATLKHFMANNSEYNRNTGSSDFDERTKHEYYGAPYRSIIYEVREDGDELGAVMPAYNAVNGTAMAANSLLNNDLLRKNWGFSGFLVTDCSAVRDLMQNRPPYMSGTEATAASLKGGSDLNCRSEYKAYAIDAIKEGLLTENDIDQAAIRLFTARMKTGEFDPARVVEYNDSSIYGWNQQISSETNTSLAEQGADEAVILLKNDPVDGKKLLPLEAEKTEKIVITGRNDLVNSVILGGYSGSPASGNKTTPYDGLTDLISQKNPDAQVSFVPFISASSNLMTFKRAVFYDADGKELFRRLARQAVGHDGCTLEGTSGTETFLKNISLSGAWASFEVDSAQMNKVASVELMMRSDNGRNTNVVFTSGDIGGKPIFEKVVNGEKVSGGTHVSTERVPFSYGEDKEPMSILTIRFEDASEFAGAPAFTPENEKLIKEADVVIAYAGTTLSDANEGKDRSNIDLPMGETQKILEAHNLNKNTVVYIQAVGQMNIEEIKAELPAIFWCTYNGQAQGKAFAKLLFGEENPSGRLPFTWYSDISQLDAIGEYGIRNSTTKNGNGRTYQYFKGDISYPFGYGLSYSEFEYSNITVDKTSITPDDTVTVTVDVKNTSDIAGDEVVQLYVASPDAAANDRPVKRLSGFQKVNLEAGESKTVTLDVKAADWYFWDEANSCQTFDQGTYTIQVGENCEDIKEQVNVTLSGTLTKALDVVTAEPSNYIVARSADTEITTNVTVTYNDDSKANLDDLDITYSSSNPEVVNVDSSGKVTAVGQGTASVTATVNYNGMTVKDSYPIVVVEDGNPESSHQLTVMSGTIKTINDAEIGVSERKVFEGARVSVSADSGAEGQTFSKWKVHMAPENFTLENPSEETVKFRMPKGDVTLEAEYKKASPSEATPSAAYKADPEGFAYVDQKSLDDLLLSDEIITEGDQDILGKGGKVSVTVLLQRKAVSAGSSLAKKLSELFGEPDETQTAFLMESSLSKQQTQKNGDSKTYSLATASEAVKVYMSVPETWQDMEPEDYRMVQYEETEEGELTAEEVSYDWVTDHQIAFEASVNGTYAMMVTVFYTVTFKDYNGEVLKTVRVKAGESATAPEDPEREGYLFKGWDKEFKEVRKNMTVTAKYIKENTEGGVIDRLEGILDSLDDLDPGDLTEIEGAVKTLINRVNAVDYSKYTNDGTVMALLEEIENRMVELPGISSPYVDNKSQKVSEASVNGALFGLEGKPGYLRIQDVLIPSKLPAGLSRISNAFALDIKLFSENGSNKPVKGLLKITMDLPETIDTEKEIVVIHYKDGSSDGSFCKYSLEGNQMVFVVDSLSTFTIANVNAGTDKPDRDSDDSDRDAAEKVTAGTWLMDERGWWYRNADGSWPKSAWKKISSQGNDFWYYFNEEGYMATGWFQDTDGQIYYLEETKDQTVGRMAVGWKLIGEKWYYFNTASDGTMGALYRSKVTPDGYPVNESGVWVP